MAAALVATLITPAAAAHAAASPAAAPVAAPPAITSVVTATTVPAPPASGERPAPVAVTLITGDKVTLTQRAGGAAPSVSVERAPGATGAVRIASEGGDTFVYPDEALPYIASGQLDKQLFDVTRLVAQGYDDAHAGALPLIVTRTGGSTQPAGTTLPGAETTRSLPSVHGEAVHARRSKAARFWSALTGPARENARRSAATSLGAGATSSSEVAPPFTAGVDKVWLDATAQAAMADTAEQIGAPSAWAAGATGKGVRVAVLDSGVDATHPDLADRIVASRSFVTGQDTTDRNGHGTHTASTVVGTGAASDGRERGIAPGADLVVGKVLADSGSGPISGIIAGMEWAARTEHAKVINMSLGTPAWHTQDDPVAQAVNRLSAETGALFVIASGNSGNSPYTVSSPGTADAALTVGAVDGADRLADFSSVGPRQNDDGLKPDLSAPGVNVLAARSQYMNDGGEGYYRTDSGTSMAAPHVAGAAVLLAQKHPEWTGSRIKDALMDTSASTPEYSPYETGAGRLDVADAYLRDKIVADGSVDAGLVRWSPEAGRKPVSREISYANTTDASVTLSLAVEAATAPAGVFTPAADHLTVPAHGSASVGLTVNPDGLAPGRYTARVVARHSGGTVHTTLGFSVESEKYDLTVHLKDRKGKPVGGEVEITGADGHTDVMWARDGTITSRRAPGSYTIDSALDVEGLHGSHSLGFALLTAPEVVLTSDRVVELDASGIRQVRTATPRPTTVTNTRIDLYRSFTSTEPTPYDEKALHESYMLPAVYDSLWALPTAGKVKRGSFVFTTRIRAEQTPLKIGYGGHGTGDVPLPQPGAPLLPEGTTHLEAVFAGTGTPAEYAGGSARGRAVVVRSDDDVAPTAQAAAAHTAGAAMLLVVNDDDGRKSDWYGDPDGMATGQLPVASLPLDDGEALIGKISSARRNRIELTVQAHPSPKYLYDLVDYHRGGIPADPSADTAPGALARIDIDFNSPAGQRLVESREDTPAYEFWSAGYPYGVFGVQRVPKFPSESVPTGRRTDWVSAGSDVRWQQYASIGLWGAYTDVVSFRPGSVQKDRWFGPVTRPRMVTAEIPYRVGNGMSAIVKGFGDGGSAHSGDWGAMGKTFALYQGDNLLSQSAGWPNLGAGDLSPRKLPYKLVVDTTGNADVSPYSTTTHTEWDFLSGTADELQAIPLVQLDYGLDVDRAGRVKRGSDFSVTPDVLGSDAAHDTVSSLSLEISYDDGASWHRRELREEKGTWRTSLNAPSLARYVSIRVTAKQHNGGGITQTISRAFGLK